MSAPDPGARARGVAAVFDRVADVYDAVGIEWFSPIAAELVRLVDPAPGEQVLDLGCGRGAALFPLVEAVGGSGRVTGVDLASRMIALTQADVDARGITTVDLHRADASEPGLPQESFDAAVASLVIFFLPDPPAALRAWSSLLRPGGRLGLTTFGDRTSAWEEVDAVFRPYLPAHLLDARTSGQKGPFASDEGVADLVRSAGFVDVRTINRSADIELADVREWQTWSRSHGQRAMWDEVPESEHALVLERVTPIFERLRGSNGRIRLDQRVRYTVAKRPPADGPSDGRETVTVRPRA